VTNFFRRRRNLEARERLRRARPEPRAEFLEMLADRERARWRARRPRARFAFAGAFSVVVLVALAAVGGLGYAASAVNSASHAVTAVLQPNKPKVVDQNSASDQYTKKVKMCHRGHTILVSKSTVAAHLRRGDKLGPCTRMCHRGRTIVVRGRTTAALRSNIRAHLRLGDTLGPCRRRSP
jgi:hypothetical protein